jgi:2-polyprenyl-3-methyl-5-hydroxy-6-metoxy-1,4-benzoquinol methylase
MSDDRTGAAGAPQNIYDDPAFFAGYRDLRTNDTGLNGALEMPALHRLLPDLAGARVLDLGCGFGDFARLARARGAAAVTGVDISERMLAEAARRTDDAAIAYERSPIETYRPAQAYDLVVSSLALHYVADYAAVARRVFEALRPGGRFLFSVEHPMCTAHPVGWVKDGAGTKLHWPVDRYGDEGPRATHWFVDGVVKYHRTVETYAGTLLGAGFLLAHLGEPGPAPAALAARPALATETRRPPFLVLLAVRPAAGAQPC